MSSVSPDEFHGTKLMGPKSITKDKQDFLVDLIKSLDHRFTNSEALNSTKVIDFKSWPDPKSENAQG